jgi:tetratricopeptide (TPR) repeat protein
MKEDALELLMGTYQQAGNQAKVIDAANRLLAANPDNARGLVLLAYNERAAQKWADAKQHAEKGLQALAKMPKADGVSDADFAKQKTQLSALLNSVAGFSALQLKDYASAQKYLRPAVEADPNNVENVYPLALAYLTATPPDDVNGLFFIARAANLVTDPKGKDSIVKFGHNRYVKYHGSEQGWNDLLAQTKTTPVPPAGFTIARYVPPTPAQQAAELVKTKKPEEMSFAEWELVLSEAAPEDQEKVWSVLKGKNLQTKLELAASVDDIDQKRADIELSFPAPIPTRSLPKVGDKINFEGTPVSYTPKPFVIVMEKGALLTKAAPAPARKPPVHRKPQ